MEYSCNPSPSTSLILTLINCFTQGGIMKKEIYEDVLSGITKQIESGVLPWKMPWTKLGAPKNFVSNNKYRGINTFLLINNGFDSNLWGTFKQISQAGGRVKKGEKSRRIIFWKFLKSEKIENGEKKEEVFPILKIHSVFNLDQTEGLEKFKIFNPENEISPEESAEKIILNSSNDLKINFGSEIACYVPSTDEIYMPNKIRFESSGEYYSTLFHELVHWTGSNKRLNRFDDNLGEHKKGEEYSKEELVAEFGASFLLAEAGIYNLDLMKNNASYISSWAKFIKDNPLTLISAANKAQKACDYILGVNQDEEGPE